MKKLQKRQKRWGHSWLPYLLRMAMGGGISLYILCRLRGGKL